MFLNLAKMLYSLESQIVEKIAIIYDDNTTSKVLDKIILANSPKANIMYKIKDKNTIGEIE